MSTGKMTVTTPSDCEIHVTRPFNAPRRLLWDVHTKPELLKRWLFGPDGWSLEVCTIDLRVGGKARFEMVKKDKDDNDPNQIGYGMVKMGWTDTYVEIAPQERIVNTQIFDEDWTDGETTITVVFRDAGDKSVLEMTILYSSKEARDGAIENGVDGMEIGYGRLDAYFAEIEAKGGGAG
jgi:uncharacterized protein YndB with AHSA1/START domain